MREFEALSDTQLDQAYASSWDTLDFPTAAKYGEEIRARLMDLTSFVGGIFGRQEFPLYNARVATMGGYTSADSATDSVADAVNELPVTIADMAENAASSVGKTAAALISPLDKYIYIVAAVVAVGLVVYASRK